jgi:glycosyltransferase involved in cell wall biosynthesis
MKLLVIATAPLVYKNNSWNLYSPYEKEMQLWAKYSDKIQFCCPIWETDNNLLVSEVSFKMETPIKLKEFNIKSFKNYFGAILSSIVNLKILFFAMKNANHIHFRCPGNITFLAVFVQILFPKKIKTAKYAGNWDPKSKQPLSYRLQKSILSNTFLTKNMQVLVYGKWENQTKNIIPFFTATYSETEKKEVYVREDSGAFKFLFVGTLSVGKQPLYAVKLVEELHKTGVNVTLNIFGYGVLYKDLERYIERKSLNSFVFLKGNQSTNILKKAYQESHFLVLPSKSEGWPKAVAEAMFWGCVPIATKISCVSFMLANGERGVLLDENLEKDVLKIQELVQEENKYQSKVDKAKRWSREYTLEFFEAEIKKLLL